jgi:hypothetical protein
MESTRPGGLLAWQLRGYPTTHRSRVTLLTHALTAPLFLLGTCALALAPVLGAWLLAPALPGMILPVALQGRSHRLEQTRPEPFRSAADFAVRLFVEQWVTFPRFVLSGGFTRNWRETERQGGPRTA